jgi:sugar lactone lactonase YvrE
MTATTEFKFTGPNRDRRRGFLGFLLAASLAVTGLVTTANHTPASATVGDVSTAAGVPPELRYPQGVAVDGNSGYLYVADASGHRIRRFGSDGSKVTLAGTGTLGFADGPGSSAKFHLPSGIAARNGEVFVADMINSRIRKIDASGDVTTVAGTGQTGSADGPGATATFIYPRGLAVDGAGNLFVADSGTNKIRKITAGGVVSTLAGTGAAGSNDGPALSATFSGVSGIAVDSLGKVYVADAGNRKIRVIDTSGDVTTLAGSGAVGSVDGPAASATFTTPQWLSVKTDGLGATTVYVTDRDKHNVRKISPEGVVSTLAGTGTPGFADGPAATATFDQPAGIVINNFGELYVADASNERIRVVVPGGGGYVSTFVGAPQMESPTGVASDSAGNAYIADSGSHRILKLSAGGQLLPIAGSGVAGSIDGQSFNATFSNPRSVAVDINGDVLVADTGNNKIRRVTSAGVVSTVAGTGAVGATNGPATSARFDQPNALAVDGFGNIYVSDYGNNMIRKIATNGVVSTLAGTGSPGATNGPAAAATFSTLTGIAIEPSTGAIYVTEYSGNRIRKILGGTVSTFAGTGGSGWDDGPVTSATFTQPVGISVWGNDVYVVDSYTGKIRRIRNGMVSTIAGPPFVDVFGYADGPGPSARFTAPQGSSVVLAANGLFLLVADTGNNVIRRVALEPSNAGAAFVAVPATRLKDTRPNPVAAGTTIDVQVAGGTTPVPADADAVVLNVAAVAPLGAGHIRVYPTGTPLPNASVLNFAAGKNTPNQVIVKVGTGGSVTLYAGNTTNMIVDISGYFTNGLAATPSRYVPILNPTTLSTITIPALGTSNVQIAGNGNYPPTGIVAITQVAINVAALNPTAAGHLRVYPAGGTVPPTSTNNFVAGDSRTNLAITALGPNGDISIWNTTTQPLSVRIDSVGYFTTASETGFVPVVPIRPLDTRLPGFGAVTSGGYREVQIRGFGPVPNLPRVKAVVVNVAAVNPTLAGTFSGGPSGVVSTLESLIHPANENVANLMILPVGADGNIRITNNMAPGGTSHMIVDITGYFFG